ncbi:MAG: DUF2786 domain-containing protein [Betaproteobacteria bacterium]|nr:DUF2786 domain-containing protein [Betaproteobacteria bacterium]
MNVIDKIRCLRRLSENKSATPAEAANAAARVQELMLKHKLTAADVGEDEEDVTWWPEPLWTGKNRSPWRSVLAIGIATANACRILHGAAPGAARKMTVVGKKSDAEVVRYLYAFLEREIERHCKEFLDKSSESAPGSAKMRAKSFRLGFAETVSRRLREERTKAKAEAATSTTMERGLIRLDQDEAAIQKWIENKGLTSTKPKSVSVDSASWKAGCARGASIPIRSALASG